MDDPSSPPTKQKSTRVARLATKFLNSSTIDGNNSARGRNNANNPPQTVAEQQLTAAVHSLLSRVSDILGSLDMKFAADPSILDTALNRSPEHIRKALENMLLKSDPEAIFFYVYFSPQQQQQQEFTNLPTTNVVPNPSSHLQFRPGFAFGSNDDHSHTNQSSSSSSSSLANCIVISDTALPITDEIFRIIYAARPRTLQDQLLDLTSANPVVSVNPDMIGGTANENSFLHQVQSQDTMAPSPSATMKMSPSGTTATPAGKENFVDDTVNNNNHGTAISSLDDLPTKSLAPPDLLNDVFVGCVSHSPIDHFGLLAKSIIQEPLEAMVASQRKLKEQVAHQRKRLSDHHQQQQNNQNDQDDATNNKNTTNKPSSSSTTFAAAEEPRDNTIPLPSYPVPDVEGFHGLLTSEYETMEKIARLYVPGRMVLGVGGSGSGGAAGDAGGAGSPGSPSSPKLAGGSGLNAAAHLGGAATTSTLGPATFFPDSEEAFLTFRTEYTSLTEALVEANQARALAAQQAPSGVVSHEHEELVSNAVSRVNHLFEDVRHFLVDYIKMATRSARSIIKPGSLPPHERQPKLTLAERQPRNVNNKRGADYSSLATGGGSASASHQQSAASANVTTTTSSNSGNSIALNRLHDHDGPLSEAVAWTSVKLDLEAILAKISSTSIEDLQTLIVEGVQIYENNPEQGVGVDCQEFDDTILQDLTSCKALCGQLLGEANECLKHLHLAEPTFRKLHSASLSELPEAMRSAMGQVRALSLLVTYYREPVHIERVLVLLVYEVINVCKRNFLKDGKLWDRCLSSDSLRHVIKQLDMIHEITDLLRTHFIQYFPPHEAACLDGLVVFGSLDLFQRRVFKLKDMTILTQTYVALSESRLDGGVEHLVDQFRSCFQDLQRRCGNPFDHTKPMFDRDFAEFRVAVADLDCELLLYVNAAYERRTTTLSALKLMERFDTLLQREALRTDFQSKFFQLIQRFTSEVEATMRAFEHSKADPPTPRGSGPVSGRIQWARHLYRKISEPMMMFAKIDKKFKWCIFGDKKEKEQQALQLQKEKERQQQLQRNQQLQQQQNTTSTKNQIKNQFADDEARAERQQTQQQFAMNMGIVKKTLRLYNDVACALVDYEDVWVDAWLKSIDVTRSGLQATVFLREQVSATVVQGRFANQQFSVGEWDDLTVAATAASTSSQFRPYAVNFDPALLALWVDARWLSRLGIEIGHVASDVEQQRSRVMMAVSRLKLVLDALQTIRKQETPPELFYVIAPYRTKVEEKVDFGAHHITYMSSGLMQYIDELEEITYQTVEIVKQANHFLKTLVTRPLSQISAATLFLRSPGNSNNSNMNEFSSANENSPEQLEFLASQYMNSPNVVIDFGDLLEKEQQELAQQQQLSSSHQNTSSSSDTSNHHHQKLLVLTPQALANRSKSILDGVIRVARCFNPSWLPNEQAPENNNSNNNNNNNNNNNINPTEVWTQLQKLYVLIHNQLQRAVLTASTRSLHILKKRIGSRPAPHLFASDGSLKITVRVDFTPLNERAIMTQLFKNHKTGTRNASASDYHFLIAPWGSPGAGMLDQLQQIQASKNAHNTSSSSNKNNQTRSSSLSSAASQNRRNSRSLSLSAASATGGLQKTQSFAQVMARTQSIASVTSRRLSQFSSQSGGTDENSDSQQLLLTRGVSGRRRSVSSSFYGGAGGARRRRSSTASLGADDFMFSSSITSNTTLNHQQRHRSSSMIPVFSLHKQQEQELDSIVLKEEERYIDQIRQLQQDAVEDAVLQLEKQFDASLYGPSFLQLTPSLDEVDKTLAGLVTDVVTSSKRIRSWPKVPSMNIATNEVTGALEERVTFTKESLHQEKSSANNGNNGAVSAQNNNNNTTANANDSTLQHPHGTKMTFRQALMSDVSITSGNNNNNNNNNLQNLSVSTRRGNRSITGHPLLGYNTQHPNQTQNNIGVSGKAQTGSHQHRQHQWNPEDHFLPAFYHRVAKSNEVMKNTLIIAGSIYALKQEVVRSAQMIMQRFSFLLITDRRLVVETFMRRFDSRYQQMIRRQKQQQNRNSADASASDIDHHDEQQSKTSSSSTNKSASLTIQQQYLPVTEVLQEVQALDALEREIAKAPETFTVGSVVLDFKGILHQCTKEVRAWRSEFTSRFLSMIGRRLDLLTHIVQSLQRRLKDRIVIQVTEVCSVMTLLQQTRTADSESSQILQTMARALDAFESYEPRRIHELVDSCLEVRKLWEAVRPLAAYKHDEMQSLQQIYRQEVVLLSQAFRLDLQTFRNSFLVDGPAAPGVSPTEAILRLKRYNRALEERKLKFETLYDLEGILNMPRHQYPELARTFIEASQLKSLYELYEEVSEHMEKWTGTPWKKINVVELGENVSEMLLRVRRLPAAVKDWGAYTEMKRRLDELSNACPVLESLSSKAVKDRHWNEVMKVTGTKWDNSDQDAVLLQQILNANVARFREEIVDIAGSSEKESEIENRLRALAIDWKSKPLTFAEYKNRGLITLKNEETAALKDQLDESLLTLSAMLSSRYSAPFKSEVHAWLSKLSQTQETLSLWTEVQSLWAYLEAVFSGGDIVRQLPQDAKRFTMIDKQWGKIFARAVEVVSVIDFCVGNDMLKGLPYLQSQMALCQKSLAAYLEQKRSFFPRFYFVSDSVLLEMLAQGSDPIQLQAHFLNVFDGVASVDVETKKASEIQQQRSKSSLTSKPGPSNSQQQQHHANLVGTVNRITAVRNTANEQLELLEEVLCVGNIEVWLQDLLNESHRALRQVLRSALTDAQDVMGQSAISLTNFLFAYPSQVVLAVLQILWTQDCSSALSAVGPNRLTRRQDTSKRLQSMREVLAEAAKRVDTSQKQIHLQNVTGLIVHGQDVWEGVVRRCRDVTSFDWLRQLRMYWTDKHTAQLQLTDANIAYCDEFLDLHERLVVTQLTDRCYTTLSQALAMHMGGAPAGPAGTGKTESVKDLGRAAGKWVVVFNCSDQFGVLSLGKIFKGLASSGCWGCFDEFNRIALPVLSVVAQQISTVLSATRHKRTEFLFADGSTIPLQPGVGIFVTMNPTYAGRQELPENLKSLLRGVAMMVPDQQSIMQVRLASAGYRDDAGLAHRFYMLYSLCQQQLSKQPHYDWGLRNTLSVLRAAGDALRRTVLQATEQAIKRKIEADTAARMRRDRKQKQQQQNSQQQQQGGGGIYPNSEQHMLDVQEAAKTIGNISVDEEAVFVRTLRDMNLSKLTYEDVPVFTSLLAALFPNARSMDPASAYPELLDCLVSSAAELKLEPTSQWSKKALQLYENKCVRHGIMLVGVAGSGKTMCMAALLRSLRDYENSRCREVRLNPKAITTEQMFGRVDAATGDWYDGVFSSLWRKYCRQQQQSSSSSSNTKQSGDNSSSSKKKSSNDSSSATSSQQVFIVCDGPVDTHWIENLNTVLDDNKLLTLANGDRIMMAPNVKFVAECESLKNASPATVSRAGIVYFSPEDVGALPIIFAHMREFESSGLWPHFAVELCLSLAESCFEGLMKIVESSLKRESPHAPGVNRCHAAWQLVKIVGQIVSDACQAEIPSSDEQSSPSTTGKKSDQQQKDSNNNKSPSSSPTTAPRKKRSGAALQLGASMNPEILQQQQQYREMIVSRVFLWSCAWAVAGPFGDDEKREANEFLKPHIITHHQQRKKKDDEPSVGFDEQLEHHSNQNQTSAKRMSIAKPPSSRRVSLAPPGHHKQQQQQSKTEESSTTHTEDESTQATSATTKSLLSSNTILQEADSSFSLFDCYWNFESNQWTTWNSIVQSWSAQSLVTPHSLAITGGAVDIHRAFVPTAQSVCFEALTSLCFVNRIPIALTGTSGAGKSVILHQTGANFTLSGLQAHRGTANTPAQQRQLMQQLRLSGPSSPVVSEISRNRLQDSALENIQSRGFINTKEYHVTSSTTPNSFQAAVEEMCEKRVGSTYGPRHGHQLFLVIEDLHMSPTNDWGDQPASEFLRQLLERSGFYDLDRVGDWKNLVDIQFGASFAASSSASGDSRSISHIPPRLRRHFFTVFLSLPPVETLERVCSALLQARLSLLPSSALSAQHAEAAVRVLINVWKSAEKKLLPTPARLFCNFNWRDVTNVMQGLFVCSETCFESIPYFTATIRHELSRALSDKLNLKEDEAWLQKKIHECILKESLLHGSTAELSSNETMLCPFLGNNFISQNAADLDDSELVQQHQDTAAIKQSPNTATSKQQQSNNTNTAKYLDPSSLNSMKSKLHQALELFNSTRPRKKTTPQSMEMNLVLFDDSIRHILRISRALATPRGNIILMGGAGGGKVSLARLAAYCCGPDMLCVQPLPMSSYGYNNFLDDLRSACVHAATKGPVCFILTDTDVKSDAFLEPVGSLLASGESPGLFPIDERDGAVSAMRPKAKNLLGRNFDDSEENIWKLFVQRVQAHLHFVFCFSLESGLLNACSKKFPSIFRHSTIDFVHTWPGSALEAVAAAKLNVVNDQSRGALAIPVENPTEEKTSSTSAVVPTSSAFVPATTTPHSNQPRSVLQALCIATAKIQEGTRLLCEEYHRQYRVRVSCCSTHFLTLLTEFESHFHTKNKTLKKSMKELRGGLDKMNAAAGDVRSMRTELDKKEALLKEAQAETDSLLREILGSKVDAETKRQVIASVTDMLARDAAIIDATKVEAETDLQRAEPALNAARAALDQITSNDMKTLKALQKPPEMVKRIFDGVCILYHHPMEEVEWEVDHKRGSKLVMKDSWQKGGRPLASRIDFLDLMMSFNEKRKDQINDETCELLQPYLWQADFTYERARSASGNVAGLCTWVRAMEQYRVMSKFVAPKIEALRVAQGKLRIANQKLDRQRKELQAAEDALAACEARFEAAQKKKEALEEDASATRRRMNYASDLLLALADENKRWQVDFSSLRIAKVRMPACVLACAALLTYAGPFNSVFREKLLKEVISPALASVNMPLPTTFDFCKYLVDSDDIIEGWHLHGLPADAQSVENAVITAMGSRVPIMMDPQEQATTWVKKTITTLHRQNVAVLEKWREERRKAREEMLKRMRDSNDDFTPAPGLLSEGSMSEEAEMNDPTRPRPSPVPANVQFLSTARSNFASSLESALPTSSMVVVYVDNNNEKDSSIRLPALLDALIKHIQGTKQQPWIRATFMNNNKNSSSTQQHEDSDDDDNEDSDKDSHTDNSTTASLQRRQSSRHAISKSGAASFRNTASAVAASFRLANNNNNLPGGSRPYSSSRVIHLLGEPYDLHKDFCLMLVSKSPSANFSPDVFLQGTIIDFRVTEAGLREQLLARVVQYEREDLELRKTNLMKQINDSQTALRVQEKGLLHKLSSVQGSLVEDETVILTLAQSKQLANELKDTLGTAGKTRASIDEARNAYAVVARRGASMYFASDEMTKLSPCYVFSLEQFLVIFDRAMRGVEIANSDQTHQQQLDQNNNNSNNGNKSRITQLLDDVSFAIFAYVGRGFYEHHKPLFSLLIAARIEMANGNLTGAAFSALLSGGTALSSQEALSMRNKNVPWLPISVWKHVVALSGSSSPFPHLAQLPEMLIRFEQDFKDWYNSPNPERLPLPTPYNSTKNKSLPELPLFAQLALIRTLREDRMIAAASVALERLLGSKFAEVPSYSLDVLSGEVDGPSTPFLFLLSTGSDPGNSIEIAARRKKVNLIQQSLGQGQEEAAFIAVQRASASGSWALLHNCHLSPRFLVKLEEWTSKVNEILNLYFEQLKQQQRESGLTDAQLQEQLEREEQERKEKEEEQRDKEATNSASQQKALLRSGQQQQQIQNKDSSATSHHQQAKFLLQNIKPATLKECRIFLTSAPVTDLPIALLQRCIKLTQQPPQGIRSTVQRTCSLVGRETLSAVQRPEWRPTIKALIRLHVTLLERSKMGVEGWTGNYAFTDGDFLASFSFIQSHFASIGDETKSDNPGPVSWEALRYIVGDIHYGGRVTYTKDRCILLFLAETLLSAQNCSGSNNPHHHQHNALASPSTSIRISPENTSNNPNASVTSNFEESLHQQQQAAREAQLSAAQFFNNIIDELSEPATVTGVQPLSIKAHQTRLCAAALQLLRDVQPRETAVSGHDGQTPEQVVLALIKETIEKLPPASSVQPPPNFNTQAARPLDIFFGLESQRYTNLLIVTKDLLVSVAAAIEGTSSFNEEKSEAMKSLFQGLAPISLAPYSWSAPRSVPSPRSLTSWLASLNRRCSQIQRHFHSQQPSAFPQQDSSPTSLSTGAMGRSSRHHQQNNNNIINSSSPANTTIGVGAYWIGGFFNPQGFIQAVRQECCRFSRSMSLDKTEALLEVVGTSKNSGGGNQFTSTSGTGGGLLTLAGNRKDDDAVIGGGSGSQSTANQAACGHFEALENMPASNDGSVWLYDLRLEGCQYDVQNKKLRPLGARMPNGSTYSSRLPAVHLSAVATGGSSSGARSAGSVAYSQFIPTSNNNQSKTDSSVTDPFAPTPPSPRDEQQQSATGGRMGFSRRQPQPPGAAASMMLSESVNKKKHENDVGGEYAKKFFSHSAHFGNGNSDQSSSNENNNNNNHSKSFIGGHHHNNNNNNSLQQTGPNRPVLIPLYSNPERTDASVIGFISVMQDEINASVWAVRGACAIADEEP